MQPSQPGMDLARTYVHIEGDGRAAAVPVTDDFWSLLMAGGGDREDIRRMAEGGWMVGTFPYTETWGQWEVHPEGEEIVLLLSGSVDFILDEPAGERVIALRGRSACLVPRGTWHRAVVHEPGEALHITFGRGTEHRPFERST